MRTAALALVLVMATWSQAGGEEAGPTSQAAGDKAEGQVSEKDLKKPWDFAPEERVIEGRKREEYVLKGTLLSDAEHVDTIRDDEELWERRMALYDGDNGLGKGSSDGGGEAPAQNGDSGEEPAQGPEGPTPGSMPPWAKVVLGVFIAAAVGTGLALVRKRS